MARRFTWEYIVSTVLFSAGLLVLTSTFSAPAQTTKAAPHPYNSTWEATRLVGIQLHSQNASTNPVYTIPIGIAEWSVKGTLDSSGFKETWSVPGGSTLRADISRRTSTELNITNTTDFDRADWLMAVQGPGPFSFYRLYTDTTTAFAQNDVVGNAIRCRTQTNVDCMFNSGQYSFGFSSSDRNFAPFGNGDTFMQNTISPLKWDVTGYYCDEATEPQCQ